MRRLTRPLAFLTVCGLALLCTACGSNNKGKIEGKWRIVEMPEMDAKDKEDFDAMSKLGAYAYFDFKPDNTFEMGLGADKPEVAELLKMMAGGKPTTLSAKYKLLSGDGVELYDLPKEMQEQGGGLFGKNKDRARTKVKIDGDTMTVTDDDGKTGKFVRVKDQPAVGKK